MFSGLMVDTWVVASIVAALSGFIGFFVVTRGSAFAAHALPLTAFPGAAAANLAGVDQLVGLLLFSGLGVVSITQLGRRDRHEVATALSLVLLLGIGALFLSLTNQYASAVYSLLFGEVLGVGGGDIAQVLAIALVVITIIGLLFRPLLLSSVSPDLAQARGVSGRRMEFWFLTAVALATTAALPIVGALLVFSLMVGPASLARMVTDRPGIAMMLSAATAVVCVWIAIAASYASNWPVGFFVGALGVVAYAAGIAWTRVPRLASR